MGLGFQCPRCGSRDTVPKEVVKSDPKVKVRRHSCLDCGRGFMTTEHTDFLMCEIAEALGRLAELDDRARKEGLL